MSSGQGGVHITPVPAGRDPQGRAVIDQNFRLIEERLRALDIVLGQDVLEADVAETITAAWSFTGQPGFDPTSAQAPFTIGSNGQGQLVTGLNADQLDGLEATQFLRADTDDTFTGSTLTVQNDLVVSGNITASGVIDLASDIFANTDGVGKVGKVGNRFAGLFVTDRINANNGANRVFDWTTGQFTVESDVTNFRLTLQVQDGSSDTVGIVLEELLSNNDWAILHDTARDLLFQYNASTQMQLTDGGALGWGGGSTISSSDVVAILTEDETVTGQWTFQHDTIAAIFDNPSEDGNTRLELRHSADVDSVDWYRIIVDTGGEFKIVRGPGGSFSPQEVKMRIDGDTQINFDTAQLTINRSGQELIRFNPSGTSDFENNLNVSGNFRVQGSLTFDNDGAGSGLDADLLDGAEGSAFAKLADAETITAQWTFGDLGASVAPFALHANQQGELVTGLNADQLDSQDGSFYRDASNLNAGTLADARVAESNVTQHEAALSIAESQITDGSILARLAAAETVSGAWTFTNVETFRETIIASIDGSSRTVSFPASGLHLVDQGTHRIVFDVAGQAIDGRLWEIGVGGDKMFWRVWNDNLTVFENIIRVNRTAASVDEVLFPNGDVIIGTDPGGSESVRVGGGLVLGAGNSFGLGVTSPNFSLHQEGGKYAHLGVPASGPTTGDMDNGSVVAHLDETGGSEKLIWTVKTSGGTVLTGEVTLT